MSHLLSSALPFVVALSLFELSGCGSSGDSSDDASGGAATGTGGGAGAAGTSGGSTSTGGMPGTPSPQDCETPEEYFGVIDAKAPLISVGADITASEGVERAEILVDGRYHTGSTANLGTPSEDQEPWVAIDVGTGLTELLLVWTDGGWTPYDEQTGGAPVAYRIEVSADSTDGADGSWEEVVSVEDNPVRSRGHRFDFDGMEWVRLVVTAGPDTSSGAVVLDEIAIHDLSQSAGEEPLDTWFFMGDSITQGAFQRELGDDNFAPQVEAAHPGYFPAIINGGIGGELTTDGKNHLSVWLDLNPDLHFIALGYGTNDAWSNKNVASVGFEATLTDLVEAILDAGRVPILARIPFASPTTHSTLPSFNQVIDQVSRDQGLPCGPDLYTWFLEHPEELGTDSVHPIHLGNVSMNRLWAEAAADLYAE